MPRIRDLARDVGLVLDHKMDSNPIAGPPEMAHDSYAHDEPHAARFGESIWPRGDVFYAEPRWADRTLEPGRPRPGCSTASGSSTVISRPKMAAQAKT